MRIASTQYHSTMNSALQTAAARLETTMQKMASGERMRVPSDDPIGSVRLARLAREEAALDQYRDNIGALRARLTQNETLLDGISRDMLAARDLLVWAADGGNTSDDVRAMAGSLRTLVEGIHFAANSRDQEGRYLFSGTASATETIVRDDAAAAGSRYAFAGNTSEQNVMVGNGVAQTANVSLDEIAALLNQLDRAAETLGTPGVNPNDPAVRGELVAALDGVDVGLASVLGKIAGLGGTQNILETLETNHANVSLSNKHAALDIGQLDYGDAAVKLNGYTAALQATQKAYAQVSKLSLFDVL
ncbi:flagellin N-terminal helical domain-containing protein [Aromatoleum sp.]|uniref:flagellin N-terminal helical domain-containing protein n=1 Tax=Aromatoleum sp. TaxID=2307007 RepID=UPI002FC68DF0